MEPKNEKKNGGKKRLYNEKLCNIKLLRKQKYQKIKGYTVHFTVICSNQNNKTIIRRGNKPTKDVENLVGSGVQHSGCIAQKKLSGRSVPEQVAEES